ncbi:MAG: hypothetical protein AAF196_17315 [Planctomycetota bacterium]
MDAVFLCRETLLLLFNLDLPGALLVQSVESDSPAREAGIRGGAVPCRIGDRELVLGGDLILAFGEEDVCHAECLIDANSRRGSEKSVPVRLRRAGKTLGVELDLTQVRRSYLR